MGKQEFRCGIWQRSGLEYVIGVSGWCDGKRRGIAVPLRTVTHEGEMNGERRCACSFAPVKFPVWSRLVVAIIIVVFTGTARADLTGIAADTPGEAKVGETAHACFVYEDVFEFDITVDKEHDFVQVLQRLDDLTEHAACIRLFQSGGALPL